MYDVRCPHGAVRQNWQAPRSRHEEAIAHQQLKGLRAPEDPKAPGPQGPGGVWPAAERGPGSPGRGLTALLSGV